MPASAAPAPKSYKNCTELNKVYPHGVGRSGARDKTTGKRVTNFRVDNTLYSYNDGGARHRGEYDLDRDNDGIACEKR
ncbi:Excalibur calcium-binding domain-containing protein [Arthrobacter sp. ok362]|nr:Excalibur calcium-binding domain-containing protein [Arthrobacter sp. ok362]